MPYVILRDDDTNALTPIECLEKLYRPFLDRGMMVNLATIPDVSTTVTIPEGPLEGFLLAKTGPVPSVVAIGSNQRLVSYLLDNPEYHIVQHGLNHDYMEFERHDRQEIRRRLDRGTKLLIEAGFPRPRTFVAPYDKFSSDNLAEVVDRFRVVSTGWFESRRMPMAWWPKYLMKKAMRAPHWQIGDTLLLSHPGCLLSCHRPKKTMLETVRKAIRGNQLTVLVTHWWEYFRDQQPDEEFIGQLHETAAYLESEPDIKVISFDDLVNGTARAFN